MADPTGKTLSSLSEELLEGVRSGADGAWERMIAQFERLVMAVPHEAGLPPAECEEVFQATWMALHRQIELIREPGALPAWILTTARRQLWKLVRKQSRAPVVEGAPDLELRDEHAPDPADAALSLERRHAVQACVARLGEQCRRLLELLYLADERASYDDVAAALGLQRGSIGSLRARCLERLAEDVRRAGLE